MASSTHGLCLNAMANIGLGPAGSTCIVVSYNQKTETLQIGHISSIGGVTGIPSVGFLIGPMYSNAPDIKDLGGWFFTGGGSGELGSVTEGADLSLGNGPGNSDIFQVFSGAGGSVDLPFVEVGGEIHGGETYTRTQTWVSVPVPAFLDALFHGPL